jgi:excisionase family DNA binding protein
MAAGLKLSEVAQRLGISERTARRYVRSGEIPSVFVGGAYRVSEEDLASYLEGARVHVGGPEKPQAQVPFSLKWARTASEVEFYQEISGAPDEDNERLNQLLGELNRFVWRPLRAAIRKKNAAIRGEAPADATAGPEPVGQDEFELMRGRRNALRDEVRRRIPAFARIVWKQEGGAVIYWHVPEDEREQYRGKVEEALEGEPYTEEDGEAEARPEREELLHA